MYYAYIFLFYIFEFAHSLDTTRHGCTPMNVVILFTTGKKETIKIYLAFTYIHLNVFL